MIIEEMSAGVQVFYDTRWKVTDRLVEWLVENDHLYKDRKVLILGAGIGVEQLVIGSKAAKLLGALLGKLTPPLPYA